MSSLCVYLTDSANNFPERIAATDPERNYSISYETLHALTHSIAAQLCENGVHRGDRVGLYLPKSIGSLASVFGILEANAAYVPVDATAPVRRNAFIFQDCEVRCIITTSYLLSDLESAFDRTIELHSEPMPHASAHGIELTLVTLSYPNRKKPSSPLVENLAYILYTSGSTGTPKGVMHTHASGCSFVEWCANTIGFSETDVFSSHAPFHFDLSILDIFVAIKHGATLVLLGEQLGKQPERLADVIASHKISIWYSTPSILRLLIEYGQLQNHAFDALRVVFFAGEVFPLKHLRALREIWSHPRFFNLYGPTETNVCTYFEIPEHISDTQTTPFPIGRVCENNEALVVSSTMDPVHLGEEGELLICGGTVMQGYWNLPKRTQHAFYLDDNEEPWYRTGDIVREVESKAFVFVGRRDRMVKRRGYRVELGEIEAALYRHPEVQETAVIALPHDEMGTVIKAFLAMEADASTSIIAMKKFCVDQLPMYMMPDRFGFIDTLPKTSTDKINYQALREIG